MELVAGGNRRWVRVLAPPALFVLAFAVRALPHQSVLVEGRTLFFGYDAYYHMRRIVYSIVRFPASLGFDPYINFPDGGRAIWTPFFDWGIAALLRPLWGRVHPAKLEQAAVFIPPALGAATVVALYLLAQRHFGTIAALIAGSILSVLSAHFWYSQVGFIDHHAAVALATTLLIAAGMALLARSSREPEGLRPARRSALAAGVCMGATLLLWPGSLLHVGVVEMAFLGYLLAARRRGHAVGFGLRLVVVHAAAFCLLLPFGVASTWQEWGRFSPVVLSAFQPWYFGTATLFCGACAASWSRGWAADTRLQRCGGALALGAVLLLASAWCFPGLPAAAGDAWDWFAKRDSFQAQVAESKPLFVGTEGFTLSMAFVRLSMFFPLVPVALAVGWAAVRRDRHRAPVLLLLWWTLCLSLVTVFQKRFFNSASVAVALLFALSVCWAYAKLPDRVTGRAWRRRVAKAGLTLVTLFLLAPVLVSYWPYVANQFRGLRGEPLVTQAVTRRQAAAVEMANWLRVETPATAGWLDPSQRPEYAVLAPWGLGHILEYEARRPTVNDNFGDDIGRKNFLLVRRYYQSAEAAAAELLDRLGVRYVVAQERPNFLGEDPVPGAMFFSLFTHDGAAFDPPPGEARERSLPALERHRLIYESKPLARTQPPSRSLYKVFEYVPGAEVVGRAAPGRRIRAKLRLRTNRGREIVRIAYAVASGDEKYRFRLPYANSGGPAAVRVAPHYTLECGSEVVRVRVDERAVLQGARVAGPEICSAH